VRASFELQGLMRLLGAELGRVEPGHVRITLPRRPEVSQQHGYLHAGATSAIADSAGRYAAQRHRAQRHTASSWFEVVRNREAWVSGTLLALTP
jgi:uncharacterized protein (TIGR00369 family)